MHWFVQITRWTVICWLFSCVLIITSFGTCSKTISTYSSTYPGSIQSNTDSFSSKSNYSSSPKPGEKEQRELNLKWRNSRSRPIGSCNGWGSAYAIETVLRWRGTADAILDNQHKTHESYCYPTLLIGIEYKESSLLFL